MAKNNQKRSILDKKKDLAASLHVSGSTRKEIAKKIGKSIHTIHTWFKGDQFKAKIEQKTAEIEQKNEAEIITKSANLIRLNNIMEFDPLEFYDEFGNLWPIHKMSRRARMMLSEINVKTVTMESADGSQMKSIETEKVKWHSLMDGLKESNRMQPGHLASAKGDLYVEASEGLMQQIAQVYRKMKSEK